MKSLNDISIRTKIVTASLLLTLVSVIQGIYCLRQAGLINEQALEVRASWLPSIAKMASLNERVMMMRVQQNRLLAQLLGKSPQTEETVARIATIVAEVEAAYEAYRPLITPNTLDEKLMAEFLNHWTNVKTLNTKLVELARTGRGPEAMDLVFGENAKVHSALEHVLSEDIRFNEQSGYAAAIAGKAAYDTAFVMIIIVIGATLAMGSAMAFALVTTVVAPLGRSSIAVGALAQGNINVAIEGAARGDELGVLARALEVFKTGMIERRRMESDAEQARVKAEQERIAAQQEAIASERAIVSASIGTGLSKLAAKDLTYRMRDKLPEAYAKLQSDFNHAVEQLEDALVGVSQSTNSIASGTKEVSTASDELSKRTEQQAANLEQTAAALDEVTTTGKKAADGAEQARGVVFAAKQDAEKAGEVVRRTVDAMGNIEKSAEQIGQIISVIDEIAFQTNLLALNAGVEAARAGEAGRGFAVVASEVRALAQRSADAAKQIKGLISTSSAQVSEGVNLVAETGKALERILEQVGDINTVVVEIAAGAQKQANGLTEVNSAINQMDQSTQQNAAMVEETTAACHALSRETHQLADLIGQFRVTGSAGGPKYRRAA